MNRKLTTADYIEAANSLHCHPAAVMTVAAVESDGDGFLSNGNIKIRFEGHKFRQFTQGRFDKSHPEISYPYSQSRAKQHGYPVFNVAFALSEDAAFLATSFGKFQPMGFTHEEAGFADVREFVDFVKRGEREQLLAFVALVKYRGLSDELQRLDWTGFAKNYNGASYRDNDYDSKMRRAFNKYKTLDFRVNGNVTDTAYNHDTASADETTRTEKLTEPITSTPNSPLNSVAGGGANEPGTVICKERPSSFSRMWAGITAGTGAVTALGISGQSVFDSVSGALTANRMLLIVLGCALIALALYFYDRSAERANRLNLKKADIASDPEKINVELKAQG